MYGYNGSNISDSSQNRVNDFSSSYIAAFTKKIDVLSCVSDLKRANFNIKPLEIDIKHRN